MKLLDLMILSGIPQALAAAQTMKICDFPGNNIRLKFDTDKSMSITLFQHIECAMEIFVKKKCSMQKLNMVMQECWNYFGP